MAYGVRLESEPIKYLAGASITASYQALSDNIAVMDYNPLITHHLIRGYIIRNDTDGDILVSFDGIRNHLPLKSGDAFVFDISSNLVAMPDGLFLAKNKSIYVKNSSTVFMGETNATSGYVKFTAFYADGDGGN